MHVYYLFSNLLYFSNSGKACFSVEVFNENFCTHFCTLFKLGYLFIYHFLHFLYKKWPYIYILYGYKRLLIFIVKLQAIIIQAIINIYCETTSDYYTSDY